jgi:hypothetical protein
MVGFPVQLPHVSRQNGCQSPGSSYFCAKKACLAGLCCFAFSSTIDNPKFFTTTAG